VITLLLLLILLLGLNVWLLEPALAFGSKLLELRPLPWLALGISAWLLAGGNRSER